MFDIRRRAVWAIIVPFVGTVVAQDSEYRDPAKDNYTITFVKSDRKWQYGIKSEPYDKVSEYLVDKLRASLNNKGFHTAPPETARYRLTIELLEVTSHAATIKKPGNDVAATLQIAAGSQILYVKGYHGEAKTWNAPGSVIRRAVDALVQSIVEDEKVMRVIATGNVDVSSAVQQ